MKLGAMGRWVSWSWLAVLSGCTGAQPAPEVPPQGELQEEAPKKRANVFSYFSPGARSILWVDTHEAQKSSFVQSGIRSIGAAVKENAAGDPAIEALFFGCLGDQLNQIGELAASFPADWKANKNFLVVAEFDGPQEEFEKCSDSLGPDRFQSDPKIYGGRRAAIAKSTSLVRDGNFLLLGNEMAMDAAFSSDGTDRPPIAKNSFFYLRTTELFGQSDVFEVSLGSEGKETTVDALINWGSDEMAAKGNKILESGRSKGLQFLKQPTENFVAQVAANTQMTSEELAASPFLGELKDSLASTTIDLRGRTTSVHGSFNGEFLGGALTAMALYGVRSYVAKAKTAEARQNVGRIAKDVLVYVENNAGGGANRGVQLPESGPPVPSAAPMGSKVQTVPGDWKQGGWAQIGFSLQSPQYYSYELVVDENKRSFSVIARGDLDGDGVQSTFTLRGKVITDNGEEVVVLDPEILEENPEE